MISDNIIGNKEENIQKNKKSLSLKKVIKIDNNQIQNIQKGSIYHIEVKKTLNKEKIVIIMITIIALICLITAIFTNISDNIKRNEEYKSYESQIEDFQKKEEVKKNAEEEAKKQEKIPKLTDVGRESMKHLYKSDTPRVFLTFDDGPSTNTSKILDTLKQENVVATFFELGNRVEAMPDLVKRAYDEGHYIANHGYSHIYSQIYASIDNVLAEYNQCNESIKKAIGVEEYNSHLFRFPGGTPGGPYADLKQQAKELLNQNDILNVDWNALSGDAEGNDLPIDKLMARLDETAKGKNSVVLLMHDSQAKTTTVDALPQIIAYFRDRGYSFKNFYEIIK